MHKKEGGTRPNMTETEYLHHVIDDYLSVSTICNFVVENYTQKTVKDANAELRRRYKALMNEYHVIYKDSQDWQPSIRRLVDLRTVEFLRQRAQEDVDCMIKNFPDHMPPEACGKCNLQALWKEASEKEDGKLGPAVLTFLTDLRLWEEENL